MSTVDLLVAGLKGTLTMNERIHSPDSYHAPWEKIFGRILTPFEEFIHQQAAGGLVLIGCTVVALVLANGPLAERFLHLADLVHALGQGSRMAVHGRLLPLTNATFWFGERPLVGDSGHSEKRHRSTDA